MSFVLYNPTTLHNPETGSSCTFEPTSIQKITNAHENTRRVLGKFDYGGLTQTTSIIVKDPILFHFYPGFNRPGDFNASGIFANIRKQLMDASLPVVPTLWIASFSTIATTDLCRNGAEFYGKASSRKHPYIPRETDEIFIQRSRLDIHDLAQEVADHTSAQDIVLSDDDPMDLLVDPSGVLKIYLLDIGMTEFRKMRAAELNNKRVRTFMDYISSLRSTIAYP